MQNTDSNILHQYSKDPCQNYKHHELEVSAKHRNPLNKCEIGYNPGKTAGQQ